MCKLAGVKIYRLPSVKGFEGKNRKLQKCNMFTLKQCSNKLCNMAHLLLTDMNKAHLEQLLMMMITGVAAAVTKTEGGKRGRLYRTTQSDFT